MDEMEFTEAESNMQDLVAEYQQCTSPLVSSASTWFDADTPAATDQDASVDDDEQEEGLEEEQEVRSLDPPMRRVRQLTSMLQYAEE